MMDEHNLVQRTLNERLDRELLEENMAKHNTPDHGTRARYDHGCRCDACRAAQAEANHNYYAAHREKRCEYQRNYRAECREEIAEYQRNYYAAHREEILERSRRWRADHPEEKLEQVRKWCVDHPEKRAAYCANRRTRKRGNGGTHTADDVQAQYERQKGRCFWCGQRVGKSYHVDHVVPLVLGGSNGLENLVIACPSCNVSKQARHPMEFAGVMF